MSRYNYCQIVLIFLKFLGENELDIYWISSLWQKNWSINYRDINWGWKILTFFSKCNFSITDSCISLKFIENFVCDIDNTYVNVYHGYMITFWDDIWYSKCWYFTKLFSLSHNHCSKIGLIASKFYEDVECVYIFIVYVLWIKELVYDFQRYLKLNFVSYFSKL